MQTRVPNILGGRSAPSPTGTSGQILRVVDGMLTLNPRPITPETNLGMKANAAGQCVTNLGSTAENDDYLIVVNGMLTTNPDLLS